MLSMACLSCVRFRVLLVVRFCAFSYLSCLLAVVFQLKESICDACAHPKVKAIVIRGEKLGFGEPL